LQRENLACLGCGDFKLRNDGDGLDLGGPRELDVVADAVWWRRRLRPGVDTAGWRRKHLAQGYLHARYILRGQRLKVRANEATEECSTDVIRVTLFFIRPRSVMDQMKTNCVHNMYKDM
jgi:hypothetical protein